MAGAGFEPAKAEPCGLQPHPFDRSGTPPGVGESTRTGRCDDGQWLVGLDLVGLLAPYNLGGIRSPITRTNV